jgi:DNA invertase Pin-like site-specific DNA recombinase
MPLLDTTYCKDLLGTFISDLVLQVLSFASQLERENLLQRQAEGIAAAKAKGVAFGRTESQLPDDFQELYVMWRGGELSGSETAAICGISLRTLYVKTAVWRKAEKQNE